MCGRGKGAWGVHIVSPPYALPVRIVRPPRPYVRKMSFVYWIHILYTGHKIKVNFDLGQNPQIIMGVRPFLKFRKMVSVRYFLKRLVYLIHILYTCI